MHHSMHGLTHINNREQLATNKPYTANNPVAQSNLANVQKQRYSTGTSEQNTNRKRPDALFNSLNYCIRLLYERDAYLN